MWLGSGIAMAVAQASSYSSDSTPSLGTSICCTNSPKKKKKRIWEIIKRKEMLAGEVGTNAVRALSSVGSKSARY